MNLRTTLRGAVLALLGLVVAVAGLAVTAPPASAGQLGLTIEIRGAGRVEVVSGSLEDGGPTVCDRTGNRDHRVIETCPRIRNEEPFEAWIWLRAVPAAEPAGEWQFDNYDGCADVKKENGHWLCGIGSGVFSSDEKTIRAKFSDVRSPTVTHLTATRASSGDPTWTYDFGADDGTLECAANSVATWEPCSSPVTRTWPEGQHSFSVRAVDGSGNRSVVQSRTVTVIDTQIVDGPAARTASRSARFVVRTGIGTQYRCVLDGAAPTICAEGRESAIELDDLADGPHTLTVQAFWSSVEDPVPASRTWVVDTTAPDTSLGEARTEGRTAQFDFAADGAASYECRLDGGPWTTCTTPASYAGLATGPHRFEVRATDDLGNVEQDGPVHDWVVAGTTPGPLPGGPTDTTAPDTRITGGPAAGSVDLRSSVTLALTGTEASARVRCTLDGVAKPCAGGRLVLSRLRPGTHRVTAAAVDAAGNVDPTPAARVWTVPLDDRALKARKGWKRVRAARALGRTVLLSRTRGATLSTSVRGARGVALVVGPGSGGGKVTVYAGRRALRTLVLPSTRSPRALPVLRLASPYSGKVRVRVATGRRAVHLDGLAVLTR